MTADPADSGAARRSRLVGVKLRALVGDHLASDAVPQPSSIGVGAALLHDDAAWVYLDDRPSSRLGAALVWAIRAGADRVHVIAEADTGILARRAPAFDMPIDVWHAEGRSLLEAVAEPVALPQPVPAHHLEFRELIIEGGATPAIEHGVLVGEVAGLEVCRVVDDPHLDVTRLEVGVGAHDREAFQMLHGDRPTVESLARIVAAVSQRRHPGAAPHPLNQLAAERLLRWRAEHDPGLVGAASVTRIDPPVVRANLKDPVPCAALGRDADDEPFLLVFSSGVDLDLVPYAADARLLAEAMQTGVGGASRLVLVTPQRDHLPVMADLSGRLRQPAEFVSLD